VVFSKISGIGGQKLCVLVFNLMDSFKNKYCVVFSTYFKMQPINFIIYLFYSYKTNHANHEYHKLALLKADRFLNISMQKYP